MPRGSVFGLLLESNLPIPGLGPPHGQGPPDLRVQLGSIPDHLCPDPADDDAYRIPVDEWRAEIRLRRVGGGLHFRFEDGCEAAIGADGTGIWCRWPDPLGVDDVAIYLLGPVLAPVLRGRGLTVVHAAALAVNGEAMLLAGSAGSGKSTTAAALAQRGLQVVTDDVLVLDTIDGVVTAYPGPRRIRLWGDAAETLFGDAEAVPLITTHWTKRYLDVSAQAVTDPLPVGAVYVLATREEGDQAPRLEPIAPSESLIALIGNSYHGWISDRADRARDLERLALLLRRARTQRLVPREDRGSLGDLTDLILTDITAHE